jgi:hypothetical protein
VILCSQNLTAQVADSIDLNYDSILSRSIYYYHSGESYFIDSMCHIEDKLLDVHYFSPLKRTDKGFFQQLNTYGSPSQSTLYNINSSFLQYQPNVYFPYTYDWSNVKFFQLNKPYSEIYYSNDINSAQVFHVIHSQNVYKGLNIGLRYDVNYADGTFINSSVANQFFNLTANYISPTGVYRAEAAFVRNRALTYENGGINDEAFIADSFPSPSSYPTLLTSAYSKYKTADFFLSQSLRLPKHWGALTLTNSFNNATRIFYNTDSISPNFSLADSVLAFDHKKLTNILAWSNNTRIIPVNIGVRHDYNMFKDRSEDEKASLFTPFAKVGFDIKRFRFKIYAEKTLSAAYKDDFLAKADVMLAFDSLHRNKIFAALAYKTTIADFLYRRSNTPNYKWSNDLKPIRIAKAMAGISLFDMLKLDFNYFILNDNVWFDGQDVKQKNGTTNIYQALLSNRFAIGLFGFNGIAALQYSDDDSAVSLPVFQAKQTAYIEFFLFSKKLKTQIGVDLYYNTAYFADAYNTELGLFYRQRSRKTGNYLYADLFLGIKISRVNLFLALTHPYAGLLGNDYFQTPHYPSEGLNFRWGLSWKFFD